MTTFDSGFLAKIRTKFGEDRELHRPDKTWSSGEEAGAVREAMSCRMRQTREAAS